MGSRPFWATLSRPGAFPVRSNGSPLIAILLLYTCVIWTGEAKKPQGVDIFRFDADGKIVEHWDVLQPVPTSSNNANTMF